MAPSTLDILIDQPAEVNNPLAHRITVDSSSNSSISIPGGSFTSGHRYLLIFSCTLWAESFNSSLVAYLSSAPDGSGIANTMRMSSFGIAFINGIGTKQWFCGDVFTADGVTPATMQLSEFGIGANSSAIYSHPRLMAIDLDTTLAFENNGIGSKTDWSYNQDDNTGSSVISNTWTQKGSTTVNADGVSNYLVISWGTMKKTTGGLITRCQMRMRVDGSLVVAQNADTLTANTSADYWQLNCMTLLKAGGLSGGHGQIIPPLTAGLHDIEMDFKGDSAWSSEYVTTVVIRLSKFAAVEANYVDHGILGPGFVCEEGVNDNPTERTTDSCELISGMSSPDVTDADGSGGNPKDRITLFRFEANVAGSKGAERTRFSLYDADTDVDDVTANSDYSLGGEDEDIVTGTGFYVDQGVVPASQNLSPTWRVAGRNDIDTSTFTQALYVSFYTTLAPTLREFDAEFFYAVTHDVNANAQFRHAITRTVDADAEFHHAISRSEFSLMNVSKAATWEQLNDLNMAIAETYEMLLSMSITLSGSQYILEILNVAVAAEGLLTALLDIIIASTTPLTADMDLAITDAAQIVIEADRSKNLPLIELDDLETS
jgi:hypothetical protein